MRGCGVHNFDVLACSFLLHSAKDFETELSEGNQKYIILILTRLSYTNRNIDSEVGK